jgi:hypothetical protein
MEIQMGSVAKSYMRKGFLIYVEMRKYLTIYEKAVSRLCNWFHLNFLILVYEENWCYFLSVCIQVLTYDSSNNWTRNKYTYCSCLQIRVSNCFWDCRLACNWITLVLYFPVTVNVRVFPYLTYFGHSLFFLNFSYCYQILVLGDSITKLQMKL